MRKRIAGVLMALMVLAVLAACGQEQAAVQAGPTEGGETIPDATTTTEPVTEEIILYDDAPGALDGWLGRYSYYGELSEEFGGFYQGRGEIKLMVYQDSGEYLGYLYTYWYGENIDTYDKMLVEIRGNADMIRVICKESFSDKKFYDYQEGGLLFSLRKEGDGLLTAWGKMAPHAHLKEPERGFRRLDFLFTMSLVNEADRANYFRAMGIKEEAKPFFEYYDEDGALQLELFYDMAKGEGVGIYNGGEAFPVGAAEKAAWKDHKFSPQTEYRDAESLAECTFYRSYNEKGQLTHIDSYETLDYAVVDIHFIYRANGTLKQKNCSYHPARFGTTRDSERCYYDSKERLVYVNAYVTHGYIEDYYIYEGSSKTPSYRLTVDHGPAYAQEFVKY